MSPNILLVLYIKFVVFLHLLQYFLAFCAGPKLEEGGYYFDIDIGVVTPVRLADGVGFATALEAKLNNDQPRLGIFQAFMAAAPRHPILKEALDIMLAPISVCVPSL